MAQVQESKVPDLGDFHDVPVIEVLVKAGDRVDKDQSLVTLESDKATMEVPAACAGVVQQVKVKVGDTVEQGVVIALIEATAGASAAPPASVPTPAPAPKAQPSAAAAAPAPVPLPAPRPPAQVQAPHLQLVSPNADSVMPDKVPYASPVVRAFARELGVDLARVKGSAEGGRIVRQDINAFVKQVLSGGAAPTTGSGLNLLPWPKVDFSKFGETETQPLSRINKLSAANLARNWVMIPHVTQFDDADITELEALRQTLNVEAKKAGTGAKVTLLAFLIKACVALLKKYPRFNASLDGEALILKHYYHIGFAADTPNGLVVPVIRDADTKGVLEIAQETSALAKKARDGKLGPADMTGGCFSISSLGGIGGTAFTPIINAPEVAILGVSRTQTRVVWDEARQAPVPRLILPLSLSYDHRVIDGALAARATAYLSVLLADLRRALV
ncbi:MAG TPA: dihydrolipoyllysine-residue acetyltransferase [Nevskiaceae bacterium]|nr:dihydrolipoyllysine-residue acetyltransferase [Nevskiaceae bacterium]